MLSRELANTTRVTVTEQAASLGVEVTQERRAGALRYERGGERLQLSAELRSHHHMFAIDEQEEQNSGTALDRETTELSQPVDREAQIAGPAVNALRLRPEDPVVEILEAEDLLGWLDAYARSSVPALARP